MRLTKIKLAGFKSFVDPTHFHLPGQLVGIVGPNGCGKSNLIDAVRWVLGESSARQLRGDSMADVIFNGSSSRKPVGQAAIELVFDNGDGRLGGEYAGYREVAVRRVLCRDGQSTYYLNGSRCRRRDITDVFLGTGLGPRSYAIIEQGTISRVVEASPEQLRGFLEEAAGISRYRERRRETETRIGHTRENLSRVSDLRDELGKQLEKLQRQARNAARFRELKGEERSRKSDLLALRWQNLERRLAELEAQSQGVSLELEAAISRQRETELGLLHAREALHDGNERLNEAQARFYSAGAEVAKVEQAIRHARELRSQRRDDLERTRQALAELERHLAQDQSQLADLLRYLAASEPELQTAGSDEAQAGARLREAEPLRDEARARVEELNRRSADLRRAAEVERTGIDHLERQLSRLEERLRRLSEEQVELARVNSDPTELGLDRALEHADQEVARVDEAQTALAAAIQDLRDREHERVAALEGERSALQRRRGRLSSLETLQEAALAGAGSEPLEWLRTNELQDSPRLAQVIRVQAGWESAVEAVLGRLIGAHCVSGLEPVARTIDGLEQGQVSLYDTEVQPAPIEPAIAAGAALAEVVEAPWPLQGLLAHVLRAETLDAALARRPGLAPHQLVVTADGTLVGRDWLQSARAGDPEAGVLARAREIDALGEQIAAQQRALAGTEAALGDCRRELSEAESARARLQAEGTAAHRRQAELQAQLAARDQRQTEAGRRGERLRQEAEELASQRETEIAELQRARARLQQGLEALDLANQEREAGLAVLEGAEASLRGAREVARELAARVARLAVEVESKRSALASLRLGLERQSQQRQVLAERLLEVERVLTESESPMPDLQARLETLLQARAQAEASLAQARETVAAAEAGLRTLDGERLAAEHSATAVRERLEAARMTIGEARVRRDAVGEQLSELGINRQQALAELPADASETALQGELERVQRASERLGPINLAAIEELERESERKRYLDAQHQDLSEALGMLEEAIRRIDRETRQRFKTTFERVNAGIGELFPRLFGGGSAFLELTGEDPLDAGVAVMARPPGKRISNIHLLSGGEKALTAVALVFTIFRLNPAPFCMLDEVDAPLDEANVGRYCKLVQEMSEQVQFIVITHNKTTMASLGHLVGVTMHEPGCSRLVFVDIEEAARLAAV